MSTRKLRHRSHHGHNGDEQPTHHDKQQQIETLAYQYWEERGSPFGTPEDDWFRAEAEFHDRDDAAARL